MAKKLIYNSLIVTFVLLNISCSTITKGRVCYQHSPLLKNKNADSIVSTLEDSIGLIINEELLVQDWKPGLGRECDEEYIFNKSIVRVKRKTGIPQEDKFHLYHIEEMMSIIYKNKIDRIKIDTLYYNWEINRDWNVKYELLEHSKNGGKRLGFKCEYFKLLETKNTALRETTTQFEIFAAPKINFPSELSCGLHEKFVPYCPLEIIITDMAYPKFYSKIIAKEVDNKYHKNEIRLSGKFEN